MDGSGGWKDDTDDTVVVLSTAAAIGIQGHTSVVADRSCSCGLEGQKLLLLAVVGGS